MVCSGIGSRKRPSYRRQNNLSPGNSPFDATPLDEFHSSAARSSVGLDRNVRFIRKTDTAGPRLSE